MHKIINRQTKEEKFCDLSKSQSFLYNHFFGRVFLKLLVRPFISKIGGIYMNSALSKKRIKKFIKTNNIDMSQFEKCDYKNYNQFFSRKILSESRIIDRDKNSFISPCDSKLSVFRIEDNSVFKIKDSYYRIEDIIQDSKLAKEYVGGYCLIFRLTVDDYHRYCYVDDGTKEKNIPIKGIFHTVNPIALEHYNIYKRNAREYTILHTNNFEDVIQVEVGALMVGKISNHHQEYQFKKGEEKGTFLFGGSTIILLVKDVIQIDEDIIYNSLNQDETIVKYGERIGMKKVEKNI